MDMTAQDILDRAALLIEKNGFAAGEAHQDGPYCVFFAIEAARHLLREERNGAPMPTTAECRRILKARVGATDGVFVGEADKTQDQIVAALRGEASS